MQRLSCRASASAIQHSVTFAPSFSGVLAPGPTLHPPKTRDHELRTLGAYYTPAQLAANGVTSTTTVGQWRASFASEVGSAAGQTVLLN